MATFWAAFLAILTGSTRDYEGVTYANGLGMVSEDLRKLADTGYLFRDGLGFGFTPAGWAVRRTGEYVPALGILRDELTKDDRDALRRKLANNGYERILDTGIPLETRNRLHGLGLARFSIVPGHHKLTTVGRALRDELLA